VGTEHGAQPVRRGYRLRGPEAQEWFAARGYDEQDGAEGLTLVAEEVALPRHVLRRVWHTAARMRSSSTRTHRALHVVLHVDGELTVRSGADAAVLSPQDVLLFVDDRRIAWEASAATARIEIVSRRPPATVSDRLQLLSPTPSAVAPALLSSTVNTVLNGDGSLAGPASQALSDVIDATVGMLLAEHGAEPEPGRSPDRVYVAALAFIEEWGHSPAVTSASVHEAMHVSRQYLARIFAAHGTTPGTELRRYRARLARRLLADGFMDATEIAAAAGFPSVRTMRRVLREEG